MGAFANNGIARTLFELGLSDPQSLKPFHDRVRDRDDVAVLRCERSGVVVLDRTDHISPAAYEARQDLGYWHHTTRGEALRRTEADDRRRAVMIEPHIRARRWVDVGTGLGGILDLAGGGAASVTAVEPQAGAAEALRELGYAIHRGIEELPDGSFDVATLFHVYEHVQDPLGFLATIRRKLAPGGRLCVEVPHAGDALLALYGCEAFKRYTLWSEHLILHTRHSLSRFIEAAGFSLSSIQGVQRYPLANHLHWLAKAKPGGHEVWSHLRDDELDRRYELMLASLDATDTLIAWAQVPA